MTKHDSKTADELIIDNAPDGVFTAVHNTYSDEWLYSNQCNLRSLADITELVELRKKNAELRFANNEAKEYIESELGSVFITVCPSKPFNPKEHQAIRDLERMALGIQASIDFYIKNTSSAIQGHINYGILGKAKADNPDAIPIHVLERDIKALNEQAKQLKGGDS